MRKNILPHFFYGEVGKTDILRGNYSSPGEEKSSLKENREESTLPFLLGEVGKNILPISSKGNNMISCGFRRPKEGKKISSPLFLRG